MDVETVTSDVKITLESKLLRLLNFISDKPYLSPYLLFNYHDTDGLKDEDAIDYSINDDGFYLSFDEEDVENNTPLTLDYFLKDVLRNNVVNTTPVDLDKSTPTKLLREAEPWNPIAIDDTKANKTEVSTETTSKTATTADEVPAAHEINRTASDAK